MVMFSFQASILNSTEKNFIYREGVSKSDRIQESFVIFVKLENN